MAESFWGGGASHQRGKDKVNAILKWLAYFDYSDGKLLAELLGVQKAGQGAFFNKLIADEILVPIHLPAMRQRIFCLGNVGVSKAKIIMPDLPVNKQKKEPGWVKIAHLFCIQKAVLKRLDIIQHFYPEKMLREGFETKHIPDALIQFKDGRKIALEIELSHKSNSRIYHIFLSHVKNIQNQNYDGVLYIFQSERLCELYADKYGVSSWPIYRHDAIKRRLILEDRTFSSSNAQGFEFLSEELYLL